MDDTAIFSQWVQKIDQQFAKQKRRVLLVDNCTAHPQLPNLHTSNKATISTPNTTAIAQPVDQGIIHNLKYSKCFIQARISALDAKEFNVSILDAIFMSRAWEQVNTESIRNCFAKARFYKHVALLEEGNNDDLESLFHIMQSHELAPKSLSLDSDINCDDEIANHRRAQ